MHLKRLCLRMVVLIIVFFVNHDVSANSTLFTEKDDAIEERYRAIFSGPLRAELYEPSETVSGASTYLRLPRKRNDSIGINSISAAIEYLGQRGSAEFLVWHDGAIVTEKFIGGATQESRYNSFSMHKTLVALLIGKAISQGKIKSVYEPIATYIPEWRNEPRGEIRIFDLLQMAGGIDHERPSPKRPYNLETKMIFGDELWRSALERSVIVPSGTSFHYGNAESQLLAIVLERATDRRYADLLSQQIWRPIGARHAGVWLDQVDGKPRVFCCLLSHAEDWIRVGLLFLNEGKAKDRQIIASAWMRSMTTPSSNNSAYGFQVWLATEPEKMNGEGFPGPIGWSEPILDPGMIMLAGFGGQRTYIIPRCNLIIVRLGSPHSGSWDDSYIPNTILNGLKDRSCLGV